MSRKELAAVVLFGSIWGMLECLLGDFLRNINMPAGAMMSGIVALSIMSYTRMVFRKRGMQLGMAGIASLLRLTNPITGCLICSAIAIFIEGIVFELIWYNLFDIRNLRIRDVSSLGIVTSYLCYTLGYISTMIFTPLLAAQTFNPKDLLAFLPQILARGLLAGIIGGLALPAVSYARNLDISKMKSPLYYPAAISLSILCWIIVIANNII